MTDPDDARFSFLENWVRNRDSPARTGTGLDLFQVPTYLLAYYSPPLFPSVPKDDTSVAKYPELTFCLRLFAWFSHISYNVHESITAAPHMAAQMVGGLGKR